MNKTFTILYIIIASLLSGCGPVKTTVKNQYTLDAYSPRQLTNRTTQLTLAISPPEALAGYQTEQMQYVNQPHQRGSFAENAWASPPASMLYPLMIQSLQHSGYFRAIVSSVYSDKPDYRLDTQLIELEQRFLKKPSSLHLTAKVTLTRTKDEHIIASKTIKEVIPCPENTPVGGAYAANKATLAFTKAVTNFVVEQVKRDA